MNRPSLWSFPSRIGTSLLGLSLALASLSVCGSPAFAQSNAITISQNLAELVSESGVIVQGRVISANLEPHPQLKNLLTVAVTLQVEEQLKGAAAGNYTFHQAIIDSRDRQSLMGYRAGQHLLVLLIPPNAYGLTSPAGLHQGRFRITPAGPGKFFAANGLGNAGLFRGIESRLKTRNLHPAPEAQAMLATAAPGPVSLEALKSLIRTIVAGSQP